MIDLTNKLNGIQKDRVSQYISIYEFLDNVKSSNTTLSYQEVAYSLLILLKPYSYRHSCSTHSDFHNPYFYEEWIKLNGISTYTFENFSDLDCIPEESNPDFLFVVLEHISGSFSIQSSLVGSAQDYVPTEYQKLFLDRIRLNEVLSIQSPRFSNMLVGSKEVKGKSESSYLNLILALKETCLSGNTFKNQEELVNYLVSTYQGYVGMSESNIRDKFAKSSQFK